MPFSSSEPSPSILTSPESGSPHTLARVVVLVVISIIISPESDHCFPPPSSGGASFTFTGKISFSPSLCFWKACFVGKW